MAERSSSLACKKFSANVFDQNKCQNCFKPKDAHDSSSPTMPQRPTNLEVGANRPRTTVKSGSLFIATQTSTLPKIQVQKWEKVWFMLYSSGILEWFPDEPTKAGQASLGSICLDDCLELTNAESDTSEPFSIGVKTSAKTHYIKAENRLEIDNWCRVLKPFIIASPGYKFKKSPTSRTLSYHDSKINSSANIGQERKTSVSRTVSAPWKPTIDNKNNTTVSSNAAKKRWSATEELLAKREILGKNPSSDTRSSEEIKVKNSLVTEVEPRPKSDPTLQPYYTDLYVKPEPSSEKQNGKINSRISTLESELAEAKRAVKRSQGKADMCSKDLSDTKKQLEKANNVISIQKANIQTLTSEVEDLKIRLKKSDDKVEKRLRELEVPACNGNTSRDSIESGFIKLQSKLQENEKALIRRTRELEKANESRKKVAKHTRALLLELEGKLTDNNRRITELEEQLMNKTLDLEYEKEERQRIEREKGQLAKDLSSSNQQSKQREISKRSTELLQQAKDEHRQSKNEQRALQEIETLNKKLEGKNAEISTLQRQLVSIDKKDTEYRALEASYKKASEQVDVFRNELKSVNESYVKEKSKCDKLESKIQDINLKVEEKVQEAKQMKQKNVELKSEIERIRKECETQVLLLQEDNETTRIRLHEVEEELDALQTETDGANPQFDKLSREFEELNSKSQENEREFKKMKDSQMETLRDFNNEKNKRIKLEKDLEEKCSELIDSYNEVGKLRESLTESKEKLENASKRVGELDVFRKEILSLRKELDKRIEDDEEVLNRIEKLRFDLVQSNSLRDELNADENIYEKTNALSALDMLSKTVGVLNSCLNEEKSKIFELQQCLKTELSNARRCSVCEKRKSESSSFEQDLEDTKANHRKEMDRLQQAMNNENQTLKTQAEELKLKLTSKVILLQSDISELKAKHNQALCQMSDNHEKEVESLKENREKDLSEAMAKRTEEAESLQKKHESQLQQVNNQHEKDSESWREKHRHEVNELNEQHQRELDCWREKYDSLNGSNNDVIVGLREKLRDLEEQLLSEREGNERKIETLKNEYEAKGSERDVDKNGIVSLEELEEVKDKHSKELEEIKEIHRRELEENKSDMMMVLQALKSDSYQSSSMSNESLEMNDELKKLERYVETLKKEHEEDIERLNREHEQDLEQLRGDMMTLFRVQETYKSTDDGKADANGNIVDLDGKLNALKQSHEKELREKDEKHQIEVDQLKSDMLVAIQAASTVGKLGTQTPASPDKRVAELESHIASLERDFEEERENLQNTIKKAESATKFGLRRNEEMSNKIYQMQREMEEIDTKYQKEIKLYKEAFDQEKNRKTTIGAVPGILAENESLKVKLQELELSMEQMQVRYDGEIKRYKEKFQQENVLSVEELQLKIKSLEDTIEQMRLEHDTEFEKYTKAVKRGKVSLAGTAKERDLERKIDDLESTINIMRQKHREEVRKYRERLEDEMERHRKEVQESRAKLRKLEADTRQMEDMKNKLTELENKTSKLSKDASKYKEQELELNETKSKNRELQRQVDTLKRKLDKLQEEAAEEPKETSNESQLTSARAKLSRYSSMDSIGLNASNKTKAQAAGEADETAQNEDDLFEMNNNSGKSEIGGYKLNPGLKRPASVSAFPVLNDSSNGTRRSAYNEKRRDSGSTSNRTYQPSFLKSSTSASSLK